MPKLPSVSPRKVVAALKRAGFASHHQRGSHLHLFNVASRRMVTVPMHAGDLKRGTLASIIHQSGLTPEAFIELL